MSDPYNSTPLPSSASTTPSPPPLPLRATVVRRKTVLIRNWVAPLNWVAAIVFVAIAISKHASFGSTIFLLTPIALTLLSRSAFQNSIFSIIVRIVNAFFSLLALLKLSGHSPHSSPMLALALFAIMVLVPAFNASFLQPRENE
jgi:hypothetical protein